MVTFSVAEGEKLQGQSAYSSTNKRHYYYSHKGTCKKEGSTRIDAEMVHTIVFDWLRNLADRKEEFKRLQDEGYQWIEEELSQLKEERSRLEVEKADIADQIEIRIQELVKTKSETVRKTIEKSIKKLEADRQEADEKTAYVNHVISNIENLVKNERNLFGEYRKRIKDVLGMVEKPARKDGENNVNGAESAKNQVKMVISSLTLCERDIKIALSGVNHSGPRSNLFAPSPPDRLETTGLFQHYRAETLGSFAKGNCISRSTVTRKIKETSREKPGKPLVKFRRNFQILKTLFLTGSLKELPRTDSNCRPSG
jgi:hypothetical protein